MENMAEEYMKENEGKVKKTVEEIDNFPQDFPYTKEQVQKILDANPELNVNDYRQIEITGKKMNQVTVSQDKQIFNWGTHWPAEREIRHKFEFENNSLVPLKITNIKPTCNCTSTTGDMNKLVQPGDTFSFTAIFDAKVLKKVTKTITITLSDENGMITQTIPFAMTGTIITKGEYDMHKAGGADIDKYNNVEEAEVITDDAVETNENKEN
jgi:hypothetical protein